MNKNEFIKELRDNLAILTFQQQEDIINEYLNFFDKELENGKDETKIIEELKSPAKIAELFYDELVDKDDLKPGIRIVKRNVGLFIGVLVFDFLVGIYILLALLILATTLVVLPFITLFYSFSLIFRELHLSFLEVFASLSFVSGISLISFGLGLMLMLAIRNGVYNHLNWLSKLIKGGYHEVI